MLTPESIFTISLRLKLFKAGKTKTKSEELKRHTQKLKVKTKRRMITLFDGRHAELNTDKQDKKQPVGLPASENTSVRYVTSV